MMNRENIKNKLGTMLDQPGVYKMLDEYGNILYIGKSIALKKRITSYLGKEVRRNHKIKQMLMRLFDVEVYYTDTELDALLLECKWIKWYRPPYNTALMHTERYGYLVVEDAPHYRLKWSRLKPEKALRIVGPLTHPGLSRAAGVFYETHYPFMCCKRLPHECMKTAFGKCIGYCEAQERENRLTFFDESLKEKRALSEKAMAQIEKYASDWEFEKAGQCYDQLKGFHYIQSVQAMLNALSTQCVIGRLPIPHTRWYKYYLIKKGRIEGTRRGPLSEEEQMIDALRQIERAKRNEAEVPFLKDNIDEIKIIHSFCARKMYRIEV